MKFNLVLLVLVAQVAQAATPVLTRSYDNGRTGANTTETTFTPQLVADKGLRKLKSLRISDDPRIEAQPLYVPGVRRVVGSEAVCLKVSTSTATIHPCGSPGVSPPVTPIKSVLWGPCRGDRSSAARCF